MAGINSLDIPQGPSDAVFRAMEGIVRANTTFKRVVKPSSFRTWQGSPDDIKPFTFEIAPCMRWTPSYGPMEFRTPDSMSGNLIITCEVLVRGSCCSDLTNFWWLLIRCFYPGGPGINTIINTLQHAGARSGLVKIPMPAYDPDPDGIFFAGQGQLIVEIQSNLAS
jgi:hypothetical protein